MAELPKEIHAQRTLSYNVDEEMLEYISEANEIDISEITLEQVMEYVTDMAYEDINDARVGVVFLNENGIEIGVED